VLKLERVSKTYDRGQRVAVRDLSLEILPGEVYGLLGPNGAGKTTTLNLICYLLKPDSGRIEINGQPLSPPAKSLFGVVPQENLLYRTLTCAEHLNFFADLYGLRGKRKADRMADCLQEVGLGDRQNTLVSQLSGGMQRRLSLAIALVHQPKLLILDEPTTGLDLEARHGLWELIRRLQHQGITILLTTHLLDEAERLCQRIGILREGSLLAEGTLAELRQYIPVQEIVLLQTDQEAAAIARGTELGLTHRHYSGELAFWLPKPLELKEIIQAFEGIPLASVSRQPVRLEHIYLEVTQGNPASLR